MMRFEDVVNEQFLEKYLSENRPEYHVVENGKINYRNLEDVFFSMDGGNNPNRFIYALIHGRTSLLPSWNVPTKYKGEEEGIYQYCLEKGYTWQEVLHYEPDEDVLL